MSNVPFKTYSDSILMSMTKKELIEQLRIAEYNRSAAEEMLEQQAKNVKDWNHPRFGHWVKLKQGVKCSECGARERLFAACSSTHIYCYKCGAIMNKKAFLERTNNKLSNALKSQQVFTDLTYAENGTAQCWTCSRRTGMLQHIIKVLDASGEYRMVSVYLPQCGACDDRGMLWVNQTPCSYYKNEMEKKE